MPVVIKHHSGLDSNLFHPALPDADSLLNHKNGK